MAAPPPPNSATDRIKDWRPNSLVNATNSEPMPRLNGASPGTAVSTPLPTPTRALVETSVGVREAARNLTKVSLTWDKPRQILVITKPDDALIFKARQLADYFVGKSQRSPNVSTAQVAESPLHLPPFANHAASDPISPADLTASPDLDHLRTTPRAYLSLSLGGAEALDGDRGRAQGLQATVTVFLQDKILQHPLFHHPYPLKHACIRAWNADAIRRRALAPLLSPTRLHCLTEESLSDAAGSTPAASRSSLPGLGTAMGTDQIEDVLVHGVCPEEIDFVITMGGDGTVLYASWLFQTMVPPILPFHLGSLGFLTNFDFDDAFQTLDKILHRGKFPPLLETCFIDGSLGHFRKRLGEGLHVVLRMRFNCAVYRHKTVTQCPHQPVGQSDSSEEPDPNLAAPEPDDVFQILNDLVVDRGPSPYMSQLEVFGDGKHLTTVQADGLVVSTPTGSTAYSLSAGGAMVHPEVPAILLTPICPHTLSFRPMLLPDSMELKIVVPLDSRSGAWASFDGRHRISLSRGDMVVITASKYPVPTLCKTNQTGDWFESLVRCLAWNDRSAHRQKQFVWGVGVVDCVADADSSSLSSDRDDLNPYPTSDVY